MEIQGFTIASGKTKADFSISADEIKERRQAYIKDPATADQQEDDSSANAIQPEELLKNIKALTENGVYSVRFEVDEMTHDLVINLIDQDTGEVIRQVPSDEILGTRKLLAELRGNIVETES